MKIRRTAVFFMALALVSCLAGCGEKEDKEKDKTDNVTEAPLVSMDEKDDDSILKDILGGDDEDDDESSVDKGNDDYSDSLFGDDSESGIRYHTDRPYKGIYIEDYVTVKFTGYEHDAAVEMSVDWDEIAEKLGNGVTSEMLEEIFHVDIRNTDDKYDRFKFDDLANGDMVILYMTESLEYETYELRYPDGMEYISENLWFYEETPVIVSGLKTKVFIDNTSEVDKAELQKLTDAKISAIKDSAKDYADELEGGSLFMVYDWKYDVMGNTHYIKINDFKLENTYLATRTESSYEDTSASHLPENMVYNIYKLTIERYGTGELLDLYYRAEISDVLFEDDEMLVLDDTVTVKFAATAEELVPDSIHWETEVVK